MKIFLDDLYESTRKSRIPEGFVGVKNSAEFKKLLEEALERGDKIEALSFDNDLGSGEPEGWEVAKWLTEEHPEIFSHNPILRAHSDSPEGCRNILRYFSLGRKNYRELMEAKEKPHPWGEMKKVR